jgi:hypothetical protein
LPALRQARDRATGVRRLPRADLPGVRDAAGEGGRSGDRVISLRQVLRGTVELVPVPLLDGRRIDPANVTIANLATGTRDQTSLASLNIESLQALKVEV